MRRAPAVLAVTAVVAAILAASSTTLAATYLLAWLAGLTALYALALLLE